MQQTPSCNAPTQTIARTRRLFDRPGLIALRTEGLTALTPFFTPQERRQAGCQHRLFFSQVELCDNLIFFRRAAVDQFAERLLDMTEPSDSRRRLLSSLAGK